MKESSGYVKYNTDLQKARATRRATRMLEYVQDTVDNMRAMVVGDWASEKRFRIDSLIIRLYVRFIRVAMWRSVSRPVLGVNPDPRRR